MEAELGQHHERTLTTARNALKTDKMPIFEQKPEYRQMWETAIYHPNPPAGKKKKKGKGKKKK